MKIKVSTHISFLVAIAISIILLLINVLLAKYSWTQTITISLSIFTITFILCKTLFNQYISRHLEIIYDTIYSDNKKIKVEENTNLIKVRKDARRWQKARKKDLAKLQKQINYRKEFIGNLSHELKTPLFSIQGYVETLLDGGIHDENINIAYLRKASHNIERLSAIISDVDTIAKVESDALNLNKKSFNVFELIHSCTESLELLADKNDIQFKFTDCDKNLKANADKEKITQVLINLLTNSIKYGKEGGKTTIKIKSLLNRVLIEINDNGIGIKPEQMTRIFERFYRVDSNRSREQGGSGLGLSIAKHIVEAHQHSLQVKSEYGKGTTFSFALDKG